MEGYILDKNQRGGIRTRIVSSSWNRSIIECIIVCIHRNILPGMGVLCLKRRAFYLIPAVTFLNLVHVTQHDAKWFESSSNTVSTVNAICTTYYKSRERGDHLQFPDVNIFRCTCTLYPPALIGYLHLFTHYSHVKSSRLCRVAASTWVTMYHHTSW
jgi:hypothetical protein